MPVIRTANGSESQEAVDELIAQRGNRYGDAYVQGRGDTFWATLIKEDLAADEGFVLVDLSDVANFPHTETGRIRLYRLDVDIERLSTGVFIVYIGVITEVDGTDGSTNWILALYEEAQDNQDDTTAKRHYDFRWDEGLDLEISGGALTMGVSNAGHSGDVTWQTDVALDSPVGDASNVSGAGDLVMYVDETADTGTISISVTVQYMTEAT